VKSPLLTAAPLAALVAALAGTACSGRGSSDPGVFPGDGALTEKPGGGFYLADPHQSGGASRVRLRDVRWGRLVDVHDVDAQGVPSPLPLLRDVVIGEAIITDATDLVLETNPVTHAQRLIVQRPHDAPDRGNGTFTSILARATNALSPVLPKRDDGTATLPVSLVARNAALVLRFDDLLEDGPEARIRIDQMVQLRSGYPPVVPQDARILFDPSHGGVTGGAFHSTRVLIDLTISEDEVPDLVTIVPLNPAGLPASSPLSPQPNASVHLPTRLEPGAGRFYRLTNLDGHGLALEGPSEVATDDLVRAFRSGGPEDTNAGFLLDTAPPRVVGTWDLAVEAARDDPEGPPGFGFVADVLFRSSCRARPARGDIVEVAGEPYEVRAAGSEPDVAGRVTGLRLLRVTEAPLAAPGALLGNARYLLPFRRDALIPTACWLAFLPPPRDPPDEGIPLDARVLLRFSEPMNPDTFRAFDTFRVLRGGGEGQTEVRAQDLVIGAIRAERSLVDFSFLPRLPFSNEGSLDYRFELVGGLEGVTDLSGSALEDTFSTARFGVEETTVPETNGGLALRFLDTDELDPPGAPDVRGQIRYEFLRGLLRPRPTVFNSYTADRQVPVPSLMMPFGPGVQTPLSPFGSKLQALWRYCDVGFRVRDEALYNLDVIGLSWSPVGGSVVADFYPLFELRLSHSRYLPDESHPPFCQPVYPGSGLFGAPHAFTDNLLEDPRGPQVVVHPRGLGYRVQPSELTLSARGTPLLPFPWNRSTAPRNSYTWRDTAILARAGLRSSGIPMDVEVGAPLFLDQGVGSLADTGQIPSIGLPLLWEVRCFPSTGSLGLNSFDILLPVPGWSTPNFRTFATGGIDSSGRGVNIDPDTQLIPSGGFNPNSRPPGLPTPLTADNSFYVGQMDTVVRVSRAVTIWIDSGSLSPRYVEPVVEPRQQPGTSALEIEFRGAHAFSPEAGDAPFDARLLDVYGDFASGSVEYLGDGSWSSDIRAVDGARFLQVRFSFLNDVENALSAELDSFGLAFER